MTRPRPVTDDDRRVYQAVRGGADVGTVARQFRITTLRNHEVTLHRIVIQTSLVKPNRHHAALE